MNEFAALECAIHVKTWANVWPFFADQKSEYVCTLGQCAQPVTIVDGPEFPYFRHVRPTNKCSRYSNHTSVAQEAQLMLHHLLSPTSRVCVERSCAQCGQASTVQCDIAKAVNPLVPNGLLAENYVDLGADILLMQAGPPESVRWHVYFDPSSVTKRSLSHQFTNVLVCNPVVVAAQCLEHLGSNKNDFILSDIRKTKTCDRPCCISRLELATQLGWYRTWTTDDVASESPDYAQYISNSCTGKVRHHSEWARSVPTSNDRKEMVNELVQRRQCLYCGQRVDPSLMARWPFCPTCSPIIVNKSYVSAFVPYEVKLLDEKVKNERQRDLSWVKVYPFVKKPDVDPSASNEDLPVPEKPCVKCKTETYRPLFYYGFRAVCPSCVSEDFVKRKVPLRR